MFQRFFLSLILLQWNNKEEFLIKQAELTEWRGASARRWRPRQEKLVPTGCTASTAWSWSDRCCSESKCKPPIFLLLELTWLFEISTERATQRIRAEAFAKLTLIRERRRAAFRCPTNRSLVPKKKWQGDNWQASSSAPAEKNKLHGCYI